MSAIGPTSTLPRSSPGVLILRRTSIGLGSTVARDEPAYAFGSLAVVVEAALEAERAR